MKTRLLHLAALLVMAMVFLPGSSRAVTTSTLYSQDFSSSTFPPAGWSANYANSYYSGYGGWFWNSGGMNANNGSAMAYTYSYAYEPACYGGTYALTLNTPSVSTTGFTAADSLYVDFDVWFPVNYY